MGCSPTSELSASEIQFVRLCIIFRTPPRAERSHSQCIARRATRLWSSGPSAGTAEDCTLHGPHFRIRIAWQRRWLHEGPLGSWLRLDLMIRPVLVLAIVKPPGMSVGQLVAVVDDGGDVQLAVGAEDFRTILPEHRCQHRTCADLAAITAARYERRALRRHRASARIRERSFDIGGRHLKVPFHTPPPVLPPR
jgi:hypothetical protein